MENHIVLIVVAVTQLAVLIVFGVYAWVKIWPIRDQIDRFEMLFVVLILGALTVELVSDIMNSISVFAEDYLSEKFNNASLALLFTCSVMYTLVFIVFVFRMLSRLAHYKRNLERIDVRRHVLNSYGTNNQEDEELYFQSLQEIESSVLKKYSYCLFAFCSCYIAV